MPRVALLLAALARAASQTPPGNASCALPTTGLTVSTLAGAGIASFGTSFGSTDGVGTLAQINSPTFVTVDANGMVFVTQVADQVIRAIAPDGTVTRLAGAVGVSGSTDGIGTAASFSSPSGLAVDGVGNIFVADNANNKIRVVTPSGNVSSVVGGGNDDGVACPLTDPVTCHYCCSGQVDGAGSAALFQGPSGLAMDSSGLLFVADSANHKIRVVLLSGSGGTVATYAGGGADGQTSGVADGLGTLAGFTNPQGVAVDSSGLLYVSDLATTSCA